jgi:surfeit locus 1 family protein
LLAVTTARRLLVPGLSTLAMLVVLCGLGTWQVQRLAWKTAILSQIDQAEAAPAVPLPPDPSPFMKVRVDGHFREDLAALYAAEVQDTPDGPAMGGQLIVPLERGGAETILVDRGWVPQTRREPVPTPEGITSVEGFVHPAEQAGLFSAADDPAGRHFYTMDPQAIGAALGLAHVAPFVLVAMGPAGYPDPARHLPRPPNNHLQYAITWYGLAVVLLVIFCLYARKVTHA